MRTVYLSESKIFIIRSLTEKVCWRSVSALTWVELRSYHSTPPHKKKTLNELKINDSVSIHQTSEVRVAVCHLERGPKREWQARSSYWGQDCWEHPMASLTKCWWLSVNGWRVNISWESSSFLDFTSRKLCHVLTWRSEKTPFLCWAWGVSSHHLKWPQCLVNDTVLTSKATYSARALSDGERAIIPL